MFGLLAAGSVTPTAWADTTAATPQDSALNLPQIKIDGEASSTFKVDRVTSAKISQPLLLDGFQLYGIPGAGRTLTASVDYEF
ncbi:hypothetical protein AWV77_08505 [Pseudomonas palleroniana]|uniref:Uncharacterized protein n=2 Tax=Pseudomonas palleroniana TaxID=191390 RepID=A0A0X7K7B2_9PSED|nr:hypothetical protein AWV77_08505 [Pseudomonas palleroniana]